MAKFTRKTQKQFGSTAGPTEVGQFGSFAAGSPAYTTDPDSIQLLSNYLAGWYAAVAGNNSPCIEDMNALCFLFSYQLSYVLQTGVQEWDASTTYYTGSIANDGSGNLYASLTDSNTNNALTDGTKWRPILNNSSVLTKTSNYTLTNSDYFVRMSGTSTATLPATPITGEEHVIKNVDSGGLVTTVGGNGKTIDGGTVFSLAERYQFVHVKYNGTSWDIIGW